MRAKLKPFFGHKWRTVTRPRVIERAGGRCERCGRQPALLDFFRLEVAHLVIEPGEPGHDDDDNLAALCPACHKAHDYKTWAAKCRETRATHKDRARPILQLMETA